MRLSKSNRGLVTILKNLPLSMTETEIATSFSAIGVTSKRGFTLSASHISDFFRNDLGVRRQRFARKPSRSN